MFFRLLAAFILIPLVELYLLLQLAHATSVGTTLMIVIVTGIIGSYLAKREGIKTLSRFQDAVRQGRMPSKEIQDGVMIIIAGALLLTPGIFTDAFGFTLLIPIGRDFIRRVFLSRFIGRFNVHVVTGTQTPTSSEPYSASNDRFRGRTVEGKVVSGSDVE